MSIQTHTLSNGFRIVTEHMPGLQSASVGIWITAGARNETLAQNGIAHFLEHMLFLGTEDFPDENSYSSFLQVCLNRF